MVPLSQLLPPFELSPPNGVLGAGLPREGACGLETKQCSTSLPDNVF